MEVLLSAMHLDSWNYINTLNITTDATVINQCNRCATEDVVDNGRNIRYISTTERGLSRSRNMAIKNARHDICIICDNDVEYVQEYKDIIESKYREYSDADVIVFFIQRDEKSLPYKSKDTVLDRRTALKVFSPEISFKRSSLERAGIRFKEEFGAGSTYMMGEENIFLYECFKKKLKVYYVPQKIANLRYEESTWKTLGRNEKFFMDKGACYYEMFGCVSTLMNAYFVVTKRSIYEMSVMRAFALMQRGKRLYKKTCKETKNESM